MKQYRSQKTVGLLLCLVMLLTMLPLFATRTEAAEEKSIYYGRSQLAKMPKASALLYAYDQIVEGVENCADSISVYNGSTYLTAGEIAAVWDTYTRDYAHHFWLRNEWSYSYNDDGIVSVSPTYLKFDTNLETARAKFEAEAAEILSGITASMSDYEKELYLHDELASRIVYAGSTNAHNAYGALVDGVAVCEGYAEALQYLLHQVDVPSFLVTGSSYDPKSGTLVGHKWNAVKIGDNWYHVDLTWDDQGEELYHAYFNLTTSRLQEDHLIESASVALPVCSSEAAFFFTGEETLLETYDIATVAKLLKDNGYHVHVYVPGDVEAFVNWYNNNIGTLASQAGIPYYMGYSYSWGALGHEVCLELIPACDHTNKTETAAKAATCEDPGNNKYYTCNECHTVLKADGTTKTTVEAETLAPLGHDLADATCDVPAKCKRDGCDYTEGAALGHAYTNGFCEVCNGYQSATKNAAGVYEIGNAGQLYWFAAQVDGDFENFGSAKAILTADISIPETVGQNPASTIPDWNPIGYYDATIYKHHIFSGTFDGNNKKISGLYLVNTTESHVGFFEQNKGTVQNLILEDVNFLSSTGYVGGIVGYNTGSILNCSVSGTISYPDEYEFANARGGIAGGNGGTVEGCSCAASISGTHNFSGGIVGSNNKNMIDCRFSGTVKGYDAGGIVGDNQDYGVITGCTNEGSVTAEYYAGGIVGHNIGIIENCRNSGSCVSTGSTYKPGGIAGDHYNIGRHGSLAAIRNCFSTADLPLVGRTRCDDLERCPVTIENSYNYSANGYGIVENAKGTVITNCFYLAESETDSLEGTTFKTAEQFASGEVAYLLNGDQSTITWFQTCGTGLPAFSGQQVYKNQTGGCDDTTYTYTYSNTQDAAVTIHTPGAAVEENRKEPTCTESGSFDKVVRCTVCEAELSRETVSVDAKGHDEIPHEAKAPTCTEIGWDAYVTCSRCEYSTYAEKAALDHDMVETSAAVAPDCINPGKTTVLTCANGCGKTEGGDPIDPKGHDMADATCTEPAKCKRDGCDYTEGTALGHDMQETTPAVAPDCVNPGKTAVLTCANGCGKTEGGDPIDPKGHDMADATCTEPAKCKRDGCGYTVGTTLDHNYESTVTPPNCTSQGYTTYTCADCGYSYQDDYTAVVDHTYDAITHTCVCGAGEIFTVTWVVDGEVHATTQQEYGKTLKLPAAPFEHGHSFNGWFTAAEGGEPVDVDAVFSGTDNMTCYYAQFTVNKYQVRMYGGGGILPNISGMSNTTLYIYLEYGEDLTTLDNLGFVNEGYAFDGWEFFNIDWKAHNVTVMDGIVHYGRAKWKCAHATVKAVDNRDGTHKVICTGICGETIAFSEAHDMQKTGEAIAPGCETYGKTAVLTCSMCGKTEGGDPVDPMGHDMADATCTKPAKCKRDGCGYTVGTTLDHNYESTVTPPNCTSQGYTTYTCADCGYSYKANYENETGHTAETIPGVAPGCTSTGLTEGSKCKTCGDILTEQTVIPALEHDPETVPGKAATCANPGLTDGSKCKRCDSILVPQEPISVLDHTPETVTGYAATCTVPGLTDGSKCSACGTTLTAQEPIPVLDHTPETVAGYAATCTAPGKIDGSKCSACGTTLTAQEEIPILDHDMQETETAVDPGCETAGKTAVLTCSMCGKTEGGIPVDPTGHKWTDGTCTDCSTVCEHVYNTEGICTVCGSGCTHDYETDITNPTCTEQGYTTYTCKVCEYTYKGDYQNPLEHSWQDATCTEAKKCSLCGITEGEPKGHNYLDEVTPPSCTSQGYTTHTCTVCGDQQKDSYTDPTDHIPGVPVAENRQNPTCTEDGSEDTVTYCTACGTELKRESNPIPAQGHSNEDVITPPDCTNQGYTTHTCTTCGAVSVDSYTPATGHTAADEPVIENKTESGWDEVYYCVACGAEVKRVPGGRKFGDANGDGVVNHRDAMLTARYGLNLTEDVHAEVLDVNGDGKVNHRDAMLVARYGLGLIEKYPVEE